jgi:Predicted integral membrane protein (DUF2269)
MSYLLLRFLHLVGAFGFVAAHGATAAVTFGIRREHDPTRIRAYLDLSRSTRGLGYGSLVLLLGAGIGMSSEAGWWSAGWVWTALGLLTVLFVAAFPLALPYFRAIRGALDAKPVDEKRLAELLASPRGLILAWVELIGILAILWLMVWKPF